MRLRSLLPALLLLVAIPDLSHARPRVPFVIVDADVLPRPPFAALLMQFERLPFGRDKLQLARAASQASVRLFCHEIARLLSTTAFPDEQVEIAALFYRTAWDPENLPTLLVALPSPADRQRLMERLSPQRHLRQGATHRHHRRARGPLSAA
jgi:hypothetical protein